MDDNSTRLVQHIRAPREKVYATLIDPDSIVWWKVPTGMTAEVHEFEGREGGRYRISLTYDEPTQQGKTSAHTDTYHGRFVRLIPNEEVVELDEFETNDPRMQGEMRITFTLTDAEDGTDLQAVHEGLPPGLSAVDNETGWRMALQRLAALVESL